MTRLLAAGVAAGVVLVGVCGTPKAAESAAATIGGLTLRYDNSQWRMSHSGDGTEIRCVGESCEELAAEIVTGPDPGVPCDELLQQDSGLEPDVIHDRRPGLDVLIVLPDLGCRNLAASPVFACARHGGRLYLFTGGEHLDCRVPRGATDRLIELVRGLEAP
ncbi:MAG: hypothetical protein KDK07_06500 [Bauldia sp.]|nr:hypothetical protein [Bauldia sp.]